MSAKKTPKVSSKVAAKAREILQFATERAATADSLELFNELFGPDGKATLAFADEAERTAFSKSVEYRRLLALLDTLPSPQAQQTIDLTASANGAISVRLPRSVHAALLVEAKAEGVSLNQLCVSKLVAQLRAVV